MLSYMCLERLEDLRVCANCHGEFNKLPEWRYWYKDKIACTYHCMRALERADPNSYLSRKEAGTDEPVPTVNSKNLTTEERKQILDMHKRGMSAYVISKQLHRKEDTVRKVIHSNSIQPTIHTPANKTPQKAIETIRRLLGDGLKPYEICIKTGYTANTVYKYTTKIRKGEI